jgi:hypothetical protein
MASTIAYLRHYRRQRCCDLRRACLQAIAIGTPPEQRAPTSPKERRGDYNRLYRADTTVI